MTTTTPPVDGPAAAPVSGLLARLGDRQNPLLVRYVRQQLRSRAFLIVYSCVLAFATLAALSIGAGAANRAEGAAATSLFGLLTWIWAFAVWVVEPVNVFRATAAEREPHTWDLLRLTGIPPGRVVRGLFLASVVQGLVYGAAIAPFMVMAYLLRGIALADVFTVLLLVPVAGWCASAGAIFLGCASRTRGARNAFNAVVAVSTGFIWFASMTVWTELEALAYLFNFTVERAFFIAVLANFAVAWIGGALVLGAALLRHPAANRATGPRAYAWLVVLNALFWAAALVGDDASEAIAHVAVFAALVTVGLGFFALTEDYVVTPRQAREAARMRPWQLPLLFAPGAARGRLCVLALAALVAAAAALAAHHAPFGRADAPAALAGLILAHGLITLTLGDALARAFPRAFAHAAGRRAFLLLFVAGLLFLSILAEATVGPHSAALAALPFAAPTAAAHLALTAEVVTFVYVMGAFAAAALLVQAVRRTPTLRRLGDAP